MKEAEIHFAPICSRCGAVLYRKKIDIELEDLDLLGCESLSFMPQIARITPDRCPCCGAVFTLIQAPAKLPYTYSR